jgi:serine/threonine-protein kinase
LTREDFRHEIDLARDVSDAPHVVPLLETGQTDRFDWYTMPYYPAGNFRALIVRSVAADLRSHLSGLSILADVASGLHILHTRGIVHRDVYQENILIQDGRGYVTDLGAARRTGIPRGPVSRGPEVHWPPEYATGYNTATEAADVFSLAVLTYRFLCEDIPRHGSAPGLSAIPSPLRNLIVAALAPTPGDRPAMGDLHDALRQAAADAAAPVHDDG